MRLNYLTLAILAVLLIFLIYATSLPLTIPRLLGLIVAIPSFLLLVLARIQLGRAFSVQAKASTLVTTGLYSRIRNPIYFFGGLMIAGAILFANMPSLLLIFVVLFPCKFSGAGRKKRYWRKNSA